MSCKTLVLILTLMTVLIPMVHGDGAFVAGRSGTHDRITEPKQKAILLYHEGWEHLELEAICNGSSSRFVWLVPTPSIPELRTLFDGDIENFDCDSSGYWKERRFWFDSAKILEDRWLDPEDRHIWGMCDSIPYVSDRIGILENYVSVDELHASYDVSVLRPKNKSDIMKWLIRNGYTTTSEQSLVLADYIRQGWVFTAMKVDTTKEDKDWIHSEPKIDTTGPVRTESKEHRLKQIMLNFSTPVPIYPLRISSPNAGNTEVILYTFSDRGLYTPRLHMEWSEDYTFHNQMPFTGNPRFSSMADQLKHEDVMCHEWFYGNPAHEPLHFPSEIHGRMTKYIGTLSTQEMTRDITFNPSDKNEVIRRPLPHMPFLLNLGMLTMAIFAVLVSFPIFLGISVGLFIISLTEFAKHCRRACTRALIIWTAIAVLFTREGILQPLFYPFLNNATFYRIVGLISLTLILVLVAALVLKVKGCAQHEEC